MSTQDNEQTVRRYLDSLSTGDVDGALAQLAPDVTLHTKFSEYRRDGIEVNLRIVGRTFPSLQHQIDEVFHANELVIVRQSARGAQEQPLFSREPSHSPITSQVSWATTDVYRVRGGKIVEMWSGFADAGAVAHDPNAPAANPLTPILAC